MSSELSPKHSLRESDEPRERSVPEESDFNAVGEVTVEYTGPSRCGKLMRHTSAELPRIRTIAFLLLIVTVLSSLKISAQSSPFVADTLVPPHLFDLYADGSLYDFGIDGSSALCFVYRYDGQLGRYNYLTRHDIHNANVDTLYQTASKPSSPKSYIFRHFDSKGQIIALGYGVSALGWETLVASDDAGQTWDSIDIRDRDHDGRSLYYEDVKIVSPGTWIVESYIPLEGWLYVTRDKVTPLFVRARTQNSWVQLFDDDSILVFAADRRPAIVSRCLGTYAPDTASFQTVRFGEVADALMPVVVPSYPRPPLPYESECPILHFIGSDGERLWFNREWLYEYPGKGGPNAFPTVLYSYDFRTGAVQYQHFFGFPRQPLHAILFADHMFVALDSQLVYRHVNDPPGTLFAPVPGVKVGLENLQVHDGALYGSRSSGLIMRINQTSSVSTADVENSVSFTAETHGDEIEVVSVNGVTSGDVSLELFDTQGRRLAASSIAAGSASGRLPTPPVPGVYFVRWRDSETSTTLRIIVPQP